MSRVRRLFIDIETTGLPRMRGAGQFYNFRNVDQYSESRITSIAWLTTDINNNVDLFREEFIKPRGLALSGIKQKQLMSTAVSFSDLMSELKESLEESDEFLAYNVNFDFNVLCSELYRDEDEHKEIIEYLEKMKKRCIMKECFEKGYKNPYGHYLKLIDLHQQIFKEDFDAHIASEDTWAAYKIFNKVLSDEKESDPFLL